MSTRRPTLLHRLEFGLYKGVEKILGALSLEDCVHLGRIVGGSIHLITPRYRRLVGRNLRIATAAEALSDSEIDALVEETFKRGAANFLASFRTQSSSTQELLERIDDRGMKVLEPSLTEGKGLVVAMPHMGNWEALSQLGTTYSPDRRYGGVYRPLDNPLMDEFTRQRRTADGALLFSRKDGFHAPASLLREGGALVVLADQRAGASGVPLPFFGKLTTCSPLPHLMARRSKSSVAILGIVTTGPARWRLEMTPVPDGGGTEAIMSQLEQAMRRSLTDVFWFHDRWRTDSARPLSLFTKTDPAVARSATVPLRLILSTPPEADEHGVNRFMTEMLGLRPDLRIERLAPKNASSPDSRVILHDWDPTTPPEQSIGLIKRIDATYRTPIDAVILLGSELPLAKAAKTLGIRSRIGLGVQGKPWTRSLAKASSDEQWADLAHQLAQVPTRRQS
ncbi:lysophospholipid acyltransferase family protein [Haloferula rosea]|uniref:Lysophospholipid acyltransferase family protein n=1 Tax=Haloferula rosea TaxID=490093 RepID=A0A934VEN0_9BACT|nr:lysophospholipid acyltransferase family protein [Haloferula rosea]MBK1827494.1 lysophospholipid acyltransferase family protein [Haloferula rosea]